jgi:hypothetical protein
VEGADVGHATCSIDGCASGAIARGWCNKHYQRWRAHGDPSHSSPFTDRESHAGRACAVNGCDRQRRKRDWCSNHYTHWRNHGDPCAPYAFKWASEKRCVVCGVEEWEGRGRKVCSAACRRIYQRHGTERPSSVACAGCGRAVDLTARGKGGRLKRVDTALCRHCANRRYLRHGRSASVLAERDGSHCGICAAPVDMELAHPHPMSASVDHVVPRAHGGADDFSNLQLAHLTCNQKKHASTGAWP